jgi:hypothetical protein
VLWRSDSPHHAAHAFRAQYGTEFRKRCPLFLQVALTSNRRVAGSAGHRARQMRYAAAVLHREVARLRAAGADSPPKPPPSAAARMALLVCLFPSGSRSHAKSPRGMQLLLSKSGCPTPRRKQWNMRGFRSLLRRSAFRGHTAASCALSCAKMAVAASIKCAIGPPPSSESRARVMKSATVCSVRPTYGAISAQTQTTVLLEEVGCGAASAP